jgi:hypothetical protein
MIGGVGPSHRMRPTAGFPRPRGLAAEHRRCSAARGNASCRALAPRFDLCGNRLRTPGRNRLERELVSGECAVGAVRWILQTYMVLLFWGAFEPPLAGELRLTRLMRWPLINNRSFDCPRPKA